MMVSDDFLGQISSTRIEMTEGAPCDYALYGNQLDRFYSLQSQIV
jgi:hypothetical protein